MMKKIIFLLAICLFFSFQKKQVKWVAIGDSITYLNDHLDETGNRVTKGYLSIVAGKLPVSYVNKGFNGWTSGGIAEKFTDLKIEKADLYSVFLGTNDWWQGRPVGSLEDYRNNTGNRTISGSFRIIIDHLRALNPQAKIVLITPMKRVDFVYINNMKNNAWGSYKEKNGQSLEQVVEAISAIGRFEKIPVVDLYHVKKMDYKKLVRFKRVKDPATGLYKNFSYPDYSNIPFDPQRDEYPYPVEAIDVTYDGLHPSDKGYEIIAAKLVRVFKKII